MTTHFSRRDFLKLGAASLVGLGFRPYFDDFTSHDTGDIIRVGSTSVSVYTQPWDKSAIRFQRFRDDIVHVYETVTSPNGPGYNPIWYRVWGGYIHSAYVQRVRLDLNQPLPAIPEKGNLAEVTVPFSQGMHYDQYTGWNPVYRLYYQSVHWIMGVDQGPDGEPWYRLYDELLRQEYFVAAQHLRPVRAEELTPLSPEVPPDQKRIEVSLTQQKLKAYEGEKVVLETRISSGMPKRGSAPKDNTETPRGTFHVQSKMPSKHMGDGNLTADLEAYEYPGVPWTSFFEPVVGIAFHGTYWHTNYGVMMSHGCINMRPEEAKWIFRWTTPAAPGDEIEKRGMGTEVTVS
jgi:lipoprotein-anchoring transpeptidase ErfK/SrfK